MAFFFFHFLWWKNCRMKIYFFFFSNLFLLMFLLMLLTNIVLKLSFPLSFLSSKKIFGQNISLSFFYIFFFSLPFFFLCRKHDTLNDGNCWNLFLMMFCYSNGFFFFWFRLVACPAKSCLLQDEIDLIDVITFKD